MVLYKYKVVDFDALLIGYRTVQNFFIKSTASYKGQNLLFITVPGLDRVDAKHS